MAIAERSQRILDLHGNPSIVGRKTKAAAINEAARRFARTIKSAAASVNGRAFASVLPVISRLVPFSRRRSHKVARVRELALADRHLMELTTAGE
jgi:hypothetical protein